MEKAPHEQLRWRDVAPWLALAAVTAACAIVGWVLWRRGERGVVRPIDAPGGGDSAQGPSLTPRAGLEMHTVIEPVGRSRKIRLQVGGGEAILTLGPTDSPAAGAKGEGTITAESTEKGAAFVAAVARWFGDVPPPARSTPTPLKPLRVEFLRLGTPTSRAPEALRLALVGERRRAEIFFNLFPDGARATFIERGRGEARPALFALLAEALRDGPKPPRSKETDPNLATDAPFATNVQPLTADKSDKVYVACGDHQLFSVEQDGAKAKLFVHESGGKRRALATLDAIVEGVNASPDGKHVALMLVHSVSIEQVLPEDPRELRIVDVTNGSTTRHQTEDDPFRATALPVWSPDGARIAIEGRLPTTTPGDRLTRAIALASLTKLGETDARMQLRPIRAEGEGFVLSAIEYQPRPRRRTYLWTPGAAPIANDAVPVTSPDGRFGFTIDGSRLLLKDGRSFAPSDTDDATAIAALTDRPVSWVGPHTLALGSDVALALDLATAKLAPLVTRPDLAFVCVTADKKRAALVATDGTAFSADLPSPPQ